MKNILGLLLIGLTACAPRGGDPIAEPQTQNLYKPLSTVDLFKQQFKSVTVNCDTYFSSSDSISAEEPPIASVSFLAFPEPEVSQTQSLNFTAESNASISVEFEAPVLTSKENLKNNTVVDQSALIEIKARRTVKVGDLTTTNQYTATLDLRGKDSDRSLPFTVGFKSDDVEIKATNDIRCAASFEPKEN
jgi:hypothetical protein